MVSVLPGFDQQLLEGLGKTQPCLLMAWSSDQLGQKREVGAGGGGCKHKAFKGQGSDSGFFLLSEPCLVRFIRDIHCLHIEDKFASLGI